MSKIIEYQIPFPHSRSFPDPSYGNLQEVKWNGKILLYIQVAHCGQFTHGFALGFRVESKSDYERVGSRILLEEIDTLLESEIKSFLAPLISGEIRIYRDWSP